MSFLYLRGWLLSAFYLSAVWALTITENTVNVSPISLDIGSLTIYPDVYYSIVNNAATVLAGSLNNQGGFYVTSANGLAASVSIVSGSIRNTGDLAFNSLRASVVSNYNLNSVGSFVNSGSMWLGISSYSLVPPIILGSATNWDNTGRIYLSQTSGSASTVTISQVLGSITNDGSICLERLSWLQTTTIRGSGCINIMDDGHLQLQVSPWNVADSQTIFLSTASSMLSVLGLSQSITGVKAYNIVGFGNGNQIRVNLGFTSYSYNANTGNLTLSFLLGIFRLNFHIGTG